MSGKYAVLPGKPLRLATENENTKQERNPQHPTIYHLVLKDFFFFPLGKKKKRKTDWATIGQNNAHFLEDTFHRPKASFTLLNCLAYSLSLRRYALLNEQKQSR